MMKVSSLQIGELAKRAGVSIRTVRYYEELGLLPPSGWTSGGMRLYSDTDVTRLRFIRRLRALRLSLDEIKPALGLEQPPQSRQERVDRTLQVLLLEQTRAEEHMTAISSNLQYLHGLPCQLASTVSPVILDFFYQTNNFRADIHNKHSTNIRK